MASRAELVQMCLELDIDHEDLNTEEMTEQIQTITDVKFNRTYHIGIKNISDTLLKFLTEEYDYIIKSKDGSLYNYKKEKKEWEI